MLPPACHQTSVYNLHKWFNRTTHLEILSVQWGWLSLSVAETYLSWRWLTFLLRAFPLSLNFTGFELASWIYRSQKVYIIIRITTEHSFYGLVGLNAALNLFSDHINMILQSNKHFYVPFFMLNSFRLPLCFGFRGDFPFCKTFSIKFSPSNLNFKAERTSFSALTFLNHPRVTPSVTAAIVSSAKNEKLFALIINARTTYKINAIHYSSHKLSGLRTSAAFWAPKSPITIIPHATFSGIIPNTFHPLFVCQQTSACWLSGG